MADKKTPPASGSKPRAGTKAGAKPAAAKKPATKMPAGAADKPAPVVLNPPKKPAATAKKPEKVAVKPAEVKGSAVETKPAAPDKKNPISDPQKSTTSGLPMFAGVVLGGLLAGGIGYLAASYNAPPPAPDYGTVIAALSDENRRVTEAMAQRLTALETRPADSAIEGLKNDLAALNTSLNEQAAALSERLAATESELMQTVDNLEAARNRLTESLPQNGEELGAAVNDLLAQYDAEIEALKQQFVAQSDARDALAARIEAVSKIASTQLDNAKTRIDELSGATANAVRNVDLAQTTERLRAAVETGKAYADLLAEIAKQAAVDIPEALKNGATTGIPPLLQLQNEFPDAARDGLKASIRAVAGEGAGSKLSAFLKSQIGARSLEEKAGDDPDAILSRAEAALKRGDLQASVDLVRQLPQEGIDAMSDWLASANARLNAESAMQTLSDSLSTGN